MSTEKIPSQQQQYPPDIKQADAPQDTKVFGFTKLGFASFDELIKNSASEL